jgi:hypothetical protein
MIMMFLYEGPNFEDLAFFSSSQMKTHPTTTTKKKKGDHFSGPNSSLQKQHIVTRVKQTIMRRVY